MRMILPLLLLTACQHIGDEGGPTAEELASAISGSPLSGPAGFDTARLRDVGCRPFDEEPTEFRCRFRARGPNGRWSPRTAIVTFNRNWVLLSLE